MEKTDILKIFICIHFFDCAGSQLRLTDLQLRRVGSSFLCVRSVTQLCPALCNPVDCSLPNSSVPGILQARILEWLPFPSPGDLPYPGIQPESLASPAMAGRFFTTIDT